MIEINLSYLTIQPNHFVHLVKYLEQKEFVKNKIVHKKLTFNKQNDYNIHTRL